MPSLPRAQGDDLDALAAAIERAGACVVRGLPSPAHTDALRAELRGLHDAGALQAAAVGRGASHGMRTDIRGDRTLWLDDPACGPAATAFLGTLDALRTGLERRLFLGLRSVEAHFAAYPPGAGYARHRDRFRDSDARRLSLVAYLNDGWEAAHGGALRLHLPDGAHDVLPVGGTAVCFLSELEHEVLPATRERLSIAAWMRRD